MERLAIEFPQGGASYYPLQKAIQFPALVAGRPIRCFIEVAALAVNDNDSPDGQGMETFLQHRSEIEALVAIMIENGYVNTDNELLIHTREFSIFQENRARKGLRDPVAVPIIS